MHHFPSLRAVARTAVRGCHSLPALVVAFRRKAAL